MKISPTAVALGLSGARLPLAPPGVSPAMAASKTVTGYDPASMQVVHMDPAQRKVTGAAAKEQEAACSVHGLHGGAASAALKNGVRKPQWRPEQPPLIGRDELIVVLKPSTTLGVSVRVLVCGLNSVAAAERLLGDIMLEVRDRQLPFRRQAKASGDVCKGVINIDPNDTSVPLKQKLRWKHGETLSVRKLGGTDLAVVTFEGKRVPRNIYCGNQAIPVRLYEKTIPACHRCGTVGYQTGICPRPQAGRCGRCGSQAATTSGELLNTSAYFAASSAGATTSKALPAVSEST